MLTAAENDLLTRVGPGTRMGALLRRYWQPFAAAAELEEGRSKRVRLFGEDLVLFRTKGGEFGLIEEQCPHRRASLYYGIPRIDGWRCPYHGWKFDTAGHCIEQPNEPDESTFKGKVRAVSYPVTELGGMLWAYLGPLPAPVLPRLDGLVVENSVRLLGTAIIPCNWLQIMENSVDSIHTEWLHGAFYEWVRTSRGAPESVAISKHHVKIGFDEFPYGIIKRRVLDGHTEDDDDWKVGHPLVFPNALANGGASDNWREYRFQFRVPVDDTNTLHLWYTAYIPPYGRTAPAHLRDRVHVYDVPFKDEAGNFLIETIHGQDIMAWVTQGPIADRTREALNSTDRGITMYRRMLQRELELHESGGDPKMVIRKPEDDVLIQIPLERMKAHRADGFECIYRRHQVSYSDVFEDIVRLYADPVSV